MSDPGKYFANRGVERNKKPLKNIYYEVEVKQLKEEADKESLAKYKFKDQGYLILLWWYEGKDPIINQHGMITPGELKERIGVKQYAKFCQGKRVFIMQRRIDGKNIKKNETRK